LAALDPARSDPPAVISLNYDIIVDNAFVELSDCLPDYGCDIDTKLYQQRPHWGSLLKIHGSLNWSYCPGCDRLDLGVAESGRTYNMLEELYQSDRLDARYSCHGFPCPQCQTFVEPVLITPTQLKDYRNPHVRKVWTLAEQALRRAERAIIIGYSLPDDDLDVIYLIKPALGHLADQPPCLEWRAVSSDPPAPVLYFRSEIILYLRRQDSSYLAQVSVRVAAVVMVVGVIPQVPLIPLAQYLAVAQAEVLPGAARPWRSSQR